MGTATGPHRSAQSGGVANWCTHTPFYGSAPCNGCSGGVSCTLFASAAASVMQIAIHNSPTLHALRPSSCWLPSTNSLVSRLKFWQHLILRHSVLTIGPQVEFLLAAGPAEPLRPLAAVASGGESARVMLALKAAPAQAAAAAPLADDGAGGTHLRPYISPLTLPSIHQPH